MNIAPEQLRLIAPQAGATVHQIAEALNPALRKFNIDTRQRVSHFLAQLAHESGGFTRTRESFNYTPDAILRTFNTAKTTRFTPRQALDYGRIAQHPANQEMIANIAYANRMGNGDVASGEGFKHCGAGWLMITGKRNQLDCADYFDIEQSVAPQWLRTFTGAAMAAGWFWKTNNLNALADLDDVDAVSDVVNIGRRTDRQGDAIGYNERLLLTQLCKKVLK